MYFFIAQKKLKFQGPLIKGCGIMHHRPHTPIHTLVSKMSERTFTAAEERAFERDYYDGCRHWQEEAYLREWQKATGQTLREILRERTAMREAEEAREWADIQAEWAEAKEPEEPSEEEMDAYFKAEWENMKVSEDAKGYEGDELVEWEALKLENDMRFYPERFPERDGQVLELVLSHLQASMASSATIQEELADHFEGDDRLRFLAIPAATMEALITDAFQTEEWKEAILRVTRRMLLEEIREALRLEEDWVQSLRLKANESIRYAVVEHFM